MGIKDPKPVNVKKLAGQINNLCQKGQKEVMKHYKDIAMGILSYEAQAAMGIASLYHTAAHVAGVKPSKKHMPGNRELQQIGEGLLKALDKADQNG